MKTEDWSRFSNWHELFDSLCRYRGYSANAELAHDLCRQTGRVGESDFQAAEKNLRDWRRGRRIPLRRNAAILSKLLEVESDPLLKRTWDETYRGLDGDKESANKPDPDGNTAVEQDVEFRRGGESPLRAASCLIAALSIGLLAVVGLNGGFLSGPGSIDRTELPTIAYNARAFLAVGAEKLIHGVADGCGGAPSEWADVMPHLPESRTGRFVDGGLATQMMNRCGKEMAVRAVKFIAMRPGIEELTVLDAYFKIEVPPASGETD